MASVIEVKNLKKNYNGLKAVDNISFEVKKGEVFGLLGENGAGKTTTLEIIEGLRKANSGTIKVLGHDVTKNINSIKERIGVQLQSSAYFKFLTLKEILNLFGGFYPKQMEPDELLKMVDLTEKTNSYVGNLSGGQKQRFSIVASLVNDPEIVFLDEPTTGLDPLARRNLWKVISKIKEQGKTIILTTHYMEEAEILCDRIAIMDKGKIIAMGETHELIEKGQCPYKVNFILAKNDRVILNQIKKLGKLKNIAGKENNFEVRLDSKNNLNKIMDLMAKINPDSFVIGKASLEDLFIELTGKTIEDEEND